MRVFVSWAKEPSRVVAVALRDWLPDVIQSLEPWVSSADIGAGARWSDEVAQALSKARIGIICVTADNQREPWLLFEAGALAKTLENTFVCPYLIQMRPSDLAPGPLTQFQAKTATRDGTFELISTINSALGTEALENERLRRLFDRSWPDLEGKLSAIPVSRPAVQRDQVEMIAEVLDTVRALARRMPEARSESSPEEIAREQRRMKEFRIRRSVRMGNRPDPNSETRLRMRLRELPDDAIDLLHDLTRNPRDEARRVLEGVLASLLAEPAEVRSVLAPADPPSATTDVKADSDAG
jgi:hypothetical protein